MNFSEAVAEVIRITSRPDKTLDAAISLNRAISFCTIKGNFRKDLIESSISIDPTLYGDTISLSGLTRFRKFVYVKPTGVKYFLSPLSEDKIFTPKDQIQPNVYYIAGTGLTYTLSALATALEVGYETYPLVLDTVTNTSHWMLDMMPYAITDLAAARVFDIIGDDASAKKYEESGMNFYLALRRDLALGE